MKTKIIKDKTKKRFGVYKFDHETFVVFDKIEIREIYVCSNYGEYEDAKERAKNIAKLLNEGSHQDPT